jgi:Flp pilus assembly protein TadD
LAAYEKACELEAGNAQWHGNRGIALGRLGRHGDSLAAYEEACGLAPGEAQWHNGRGIVLGRLGRHEDSLAAYEKACELRPDEAQWHNSRGIVLSRLNRYEESLAALEQAVHLAPDVPYILHNHAEALVLLGRDAEAVDALRGSVASGDDQLESSVLLAAMLHRTDLEEARELCQVALTMPGKSMGTFRRGEMRAVAYALLGRLEVAEDELRRAFTDRTDADVLQSRLYELIESGAGDGDGRVDRLMAVWREHETAPGEGEA